jgi:hypothetical protein
MRKLKTSDVFRLSSIIRKLGLKKELASLNKEQSAEAFGLQLFLLIFENMDQAEEEITTFFADVAEMKPDEFKEMDFEQLGKFIQDLRQTAGLADFFRLAFKTADRS